MYNKFPMIKSLCESILQHYSDQCTCGDAFKALEVSSEKTTIDTRFEKPALNIFWVSLCDLKSFCTFKVCMQAYDLRGQLVLWLYVETLCTTGYESLCFIVFTKAAV